MFQGKISEFWKFLKSKISILKTFWLQKMVSFLRFPFWKGEIFQLWWLFSKLLTFLDHVFISGTFLELKCIFWVLCIRGRGLRPIPESIKFGAKAISLVVCAENFFLNFDENIKNWIPTSHNKNHLLKNELGLEKAFFRV